MKKISFAFVGTLILLFAILLTGCSSGATSTVSADDQGQEVAVAAKKKKKAKKKVKQKVEQKATVAPEKTAPSVSSQTAASKAYAAYSQAAFEESAAKKRVLFFHASWCPICNAAEQEINKDLSALPADVIVFKADYDKESALKEKYGITYQHTFVYVDASGNEVKKWNGGGLKGIVLNTK